MERSDWATKNEREMPFWREDMTVDEYIAEHRYFYMNLKKFREGTYVPLWKQKQSESDVHK